jgi:outer membrane protein assembly factor BamB
MSQPFDEPASTQPGSTTQGDDWPAYQRGGPMLGLGPAIGGAAEMESRWTYRIEKAGVQAGAAIAGNRVFVGDDDGTVHCIHLANGKRAWACATEAKNGFATTPLVVGGRVFIGDRGGIFYCLSAASGAVLWQYDSGASINSSANLATSGRVVFANDAGDITCMSPASSQPDWVGHIARTNGALAVSGSEAWASSCDRTLKSVDLATGEVARTFELPLESTSAPVVCNGRVLATTMDGRVTCVDLAGEKESWRFEPEEHGSGLASPACDGGIVVVTGLGGTVYGLDLATGEKKWTFAARDDVAASPAISSGRVYVGSEDGRFYVLDLATGKSLWSLDTGKEIRAPAAIGRGVVVFPDSSGAIHCLSPKKQ